MLLSQFPLTFLQIQNGTPLFIAELTTILMLILTVFLIIWEIFNGRTSIKLVLLLLLLNFESWCWLELIYMSLIINISSNLTFFFSFQVLVLLPYLIEITLFFCTNRINLQFRQGINYWKKVLDIVATHFIKGSGGGGIWVFKIFPKRGVQIFPV